MRRGRPLAVNSLLQTAQTSWVGIFWRLVSRQVGEQKTCRLVLLATVKTVSQTGQDVLARALPLGGGGRTAARRG